MEVSHVGYLPRTQYVVDCIFKREKGEPYDPAAFDACMTAAVSQTVKKQAAAGVAWVSDGETSKISYATYVRIAIQALAAIALAMRPQTQNVPWFFTASGQQWGHPHHARPHVLACGGENHDDLTKDIANLKSAMAEHGAPAIYERGFGGDLPVLNQWSTKTARLT